MFVTRVFSCYAPRCMVRHKSTQFLTKSNSLLQVIHLLLKKSKKKRTPESNLISLAKETICFNASHVYC